MRRKPNGAGLRRGLAATSCRRMGSAALVLAGLACFGLPALAGNPAEPSRPPYAGEKADSPYRTLRSEARFAFPGALPARGILLARGNFLSPKAHWIVVDLDAGTLRRATTHLSGRTAGGEPVAVLDADRTQRLAPAAIEALVIGANAIWKGEPVDRPRLGEPTDQTCSLALFDGDEVLHEFASACPRPDFAKALDAAANPEPAADTVDPAGSLPAAIGSAHREADGTLVLRLRAESEDGSIIGDGELRTRPGDPDYERVRRHLGPIPPGGEVAVRPFPKTWDAEPSDP
ncbi:hypothetical protein [Aureimonas sp. ME7]|uniref:hypothetical protein n=1 Tax=Aureimonas sp. ME7 TaxID=2744252 RepID=UPI001FCE9AF1|nr:hypothetical protein [Aureimonas sp. ME7]